MPLSPPSQASVAFTRESVWRWPLGVPSQPKSPSLELGNLVWGKGLGRRQQGKDLVMTAPLTAQLGPQAGDFVRDRRGP